MLQWTEPADFDGQYEDWMPKPPQTAAVATTASSTSTAASTAAAAVASAQESDGVAVVEQGRGGWSKVLDEEGYAFYYHEATGTTQWERPDGF